MYAVSVCVLYAVEISISLNPSSTKPDQRNQEVLYSQPTKIRDSFPKQMYYVSLIYVIHDSHEHTRSNLSKLGGGKRCFKGFVSCVP